MIDPILQTTREKMKKAIEITRGDLATIRSGRASTALVENIIVAVYGGSQRLKVMELATIAVSDAKTIQITPFDPSIIAELDRGLQEANTGLTPVVDGEMIRISIPPLSAERRAEYIKLAKAKLESGRIMIRQVRADGMKDLKRAEVDKLINEDERSHGEKQVQEVTDEMIAEVDSLGERKEQELLQI